MTSVWLPFPDVHDDPAEEMVGTYIPLVACLGGSDPFGEGEAAGLATVLGFETVDGELLVHLDLGHASPALVRAMMADPEGLSFD